MQGRPLRCTAAPRSTGLAPRPWPRSWTDSIHRYPASSIRFQSQHGRRQFRSKTRSDATYGNRGELSPRRERSLPEEGLKPGEQGILAVEHIIERSHRNRLRAVGAQEAAERIELGRRTMQGHHPGRGRSAERRHHAKAVVSLGEQRGIASGKTGADFAILAG